MNLPEAAFLHADTGFAQLDTSGRPVRVNPALEAMLGRSGEELRALSVFDLTHPDDRGKERTLFEQLMSGEVTQYELEKRFLGEEDRTLWVHVRLTRVGEMGADPDLFLLSVRDVTTYRSTEVDLRMEIASYQMLWQEALSAIVILKPSGEVVRAYPGFTRLFGYSEVEAAGRLIQDLIGVDEENSEILANLEAATRGQAITAEAVRRHKDGHLIDVSVLGRRFQKGVDEMNIFVIYRDISDRKQAEALIQRLSTTDDLTGLWNRRGFYTLAEQELRRAEREQLGLILIFGDVDDFKRINDTFGHAEGDRALAQVAHRLRSCCRGSDIIARMGGDEFVVLAAGVKEGEEILAQRIRDSLESMNNRGTVPYRISMSIGSVYTPPGSISSTFDEMLSLADRRMYEEKARQST